jgi:hypothetical protein
MPLNGPGRLIWAKKKDLLPDPNGPEAKALSLLLYAIVDAA